MDVPPGQLGDLVKLMIVVMTVMGGGIAGLVKILKDQSDRQRTHEQQMAERYERQGDKFAQALKEAVTDLHTRLTTALGGVCQAKDCAHRRPLDVRRDAD